MSVSKFLQLLLLLCGVQMIAQTEERIYRSPEVDAKPHLEEGMYVLTMFVSENFNFPDLKNKQIKLFTSFVIETDGTMTDEKAFSIMAKDLIPLPNDIQISEESKNKEAEALEQMKVEAARVLKLFGKNWVPAQVAGKPVRCLYNYPISFNLE